MSEPSLTFREVEVMNRLILGLTVKDIATEFDLSVKTVEVHRTNLYGKLRVHSLAELRELHQRRHT